MTRPGARYFRVVIVWVLLIEDAPQDLSVVAFRTKQASEGKMREAMYAGLRTHLYRREFYEDTHG